ncbi:MAG: DNA mismatch repair protein MutS, partial [Bacteroidota bacterium]
MARTKTAKKQKETPLMRQYGKIKARHPGAVLLFRLGDFYETFEEDAKTVSRVLGITLTKRSNGGAADVPLAGFPHHALDTHLPKLVQAGLRVAICEQLEDPKQARKVVKRGVVEVVTPGVSLRDPLLHPKRATYLAAVHFGSGRADIGRVGVAFADITTGEFSLAEATEAELPDLLLTIGPAEVLVEKRHRERLEGLRMGGFVVTTMEDWCFGADFAYESLLRHFKTHSLKGFGVEDYALGIVAAGATMHYLSETQKGRLPHIQRLTVYRRDDYIALDPQTQRNLELISTLQNERQEGSLIHILDDTQTPMGGRLLRRWLLRPLRQVTQIQKRQAAVEALFQQPSLRTQVRTELAQVGDLERLASKVALGRATPRDLVHLKTTLEQIPALQGLLADEPCTTLASLVTTLTPCPEVTTVIAETLVDEPPAQIGDGGLIRAGIHEELDALREIQGSGKAWIARMQQTEIERTGITSLKVGFNKVFGYYLEVTNTHKDKVPDHFIRKQTLVNAERYITPELKEYEEKVLTAQEQILRLEEELFGRLREEVAAHVPALQRNATLLAMLDVLATFAEVAHTHRYVRPDVHEGLDLVIEAGRHPVVERTLPLGEAFIPNDVRLDAGEAPDAEQVLIITGPNMAGKSVVLRQTGLIVLLAQVGAFVPADAARIGVVDRIFTRVGASDNLAAGESTFLVEMNETANILNNATPRSLILLDEVGRGTSTFDGLSIAWAIVEYLCSQPAVAARTLFATHYHELNELAGRFPRIRNYRIQVQEHDGRVVFLRTLVAGGADHSYGIEVARMAGLPDPVVRRARAVLQHLEAQSLTVDGSPATAPRPEGDGLPAAPTIQPPEPPAEDAFQMSLFGPAADPVAAELKADLQALDLNRMTPIEALMTLASWKDR